MQCTQRLVSKVGVHLCDLGLAEHTAVYTVNGSIGQPRLISRKSGLATGQIGHARLGQADFFVCLTCERLPKVLCLGHDGHFGWIAALLAYPPPIPARLLCRNEALFQHRDFCTATCCKDGRADANNTAADDDDITSVRQSTAIARLLVRLDRYSLHQARNITGTVAQLACA